MPFATAITRSSGLCEELFARTASGGWGPSEFPTVAGYEDWRYTNGDPGDDWYRSGQPTWFRVEDGAAIIETGLAPQGDDPWIWMFPGGNPTTFQFPFHMRVRFRVDSTDWHNQIDFYIGDTEKIGDVGSVGNVWYVSFDYITASHLPNLRTYGFGGVLTPGDGYFESGALPASLWGEWLLLEWLVDPFDTQTVRAKIWEESDTEPDWMAGFNLSGTGTWGGLRNLIVGANYTGGVTKWTIDYIKDLNQSICNMSGSDFVPSFNGSL